MKLEELKDEVRKTRGSSPAVSIKTAQLSSDIEAKKLAVSEEIEKEVCSKVMAGSGLPSDHMAHRIAVPYDQVTLGQFICAAKSAGAFIEYGKPSFFNSAYTVKTQTITLEFTERNSAAGSILILNAFETAQGRAKPSTDQEAMLATFEVYAAFKNAGR
ncbi:hypothetical protein ACXYTJ_12145 [Gilvimarinus sp. F26214L]|uniref:hypothetical protein n=1 Tax=Gilvimarinus sp. DZF01 TaxID=3461371 RepID=UPI0040453643